MKKIFALLLLSFGFNQLFSQTVVSEKKLGKELEKNKNASAVFVSEIDLSKMQITEAETVVIPVLSKNKIKIISGMDMTGINSRLAYSKLKKWNTTFEVKDLASKAYKITKIDGIETVEQYKERYLEEQKAEARKNITKMPVQVVNPEVTNLAGSESAWLPGQIQDKLKSNLQEYLGMKTVVDSKSEVALKKLQAESESSARDESTAIELGKITTAKFALFTKLRKTGSGYTITADFTDLTTGEQMASATSKEYSKAEYLYGSTGAVDELTLAIGNKLGIKISDLTKNFLSLGSSTFSIDDQLALAKQNEEQFNRMMQNYDAELSSLMASNDINAIQNKNRIEAEKALLVEKQNAEKKRQEELKAQKARAAEDEKLEAERSIALKTQRDKMAKDAAAKAAEVRKLKVEKQGVLGQINLIESKKKALLEIRQSVENRSVELFNQLENDRKSEEERIRNKAYTTVELDGYGKPTEQALKRRENQIIKSYEDLTNKFFADCELVKQSTMTQQNILLSEIEADLKKLSTTKTVSSLGDELKVSFGTYDGSKNGWNAFFSLYSDEILLYTDNFIVNYEALTGKMAPNVENELSDSVVDEYTNNVDMFNSLLIRGTPIVYFEIDYNVLEGDVDMVNQYIFHFDKIRVINTVSNKIKQINKLNDVITKKYSRDNNLQNVEGGIVEKEKKEFILHKKKNMYKTMGIELVELPGKNIEILVTEVTQKFYDKIMGTNPSSIKGENLPVNNVSWYDAIYFCNKLSKILGLTPVYSKNETTDITKWGYIPNKGLLMEGKITQNLNADGIRLPTDDEWEYAARGGEPCLYSGSNNLDEVGWYENNSGGNIHPVAQKKSNGYNLYDMSGNVTEWVWDSASDYNNAHILRGGGVLGYGSNCKIEHRGNLFAQCQLAHVGFRFVIHD